MNLVELVKNQLGGDCINQLGTLLGTSKDEARSAVNAAVPALLAGVGQLASTPDGARKLAAAVDSADENFVSDACQMLSGNGQSIIEKGSSLLGSLFGNNTLSGLGGVLSKFTGLGSKGIMSLLSFLGPAILGVLKGQKRSLGLDASGLAGLLSSQKQNIQSALPSGLGSLLGSVPGLGALSGTAERAGERVGQAVSTAYDTGRDTVRHGAAAAQRAATGSGSALRWMLPVLGIGFLGLLIWWATRDRTPAITTPPVAERVAPDADADAVMAAARAAGAEQIAAAKDNVAGFFKSGTDVFSSITDAASAQAALPRLQEWVLKLDSIKTATNALPVDAKAQVTSQFKNNWETTLKPAIDKVMEIPGVSSTIKPVIDDLTAKVSGLLG